ncbi:hypothetical protein Tco_0499112 [Tanacetum coccineum]
MDFPKFYKELEANFWKRLKTSWGYNFFNWSSDWERFLLGVLRPVKSAEILWQFWALSSFRVSLAHDVLGASERSPCGCVVNP